MWKHSWIEAWQQAGNLWMLHILGKLAVILGLCSVPVVLLANWYNGFIEQRITQARNLHPGPTLLEHTLTLFDDPRFLSARRCPEADNRFLTVWICGIRTIKRQIGLRYLDRDAMDIELIGSVNPWSSRHGVEEQILEWS